MKNKKGLSGIITALILIVLVLVAAGIVWAVYNDIVSSNTERMGFASKCTNVQINADMNVDEDCEIPTGEAIPVCDVTLTRSSLSTSDRIDGVYIYLISMNEESTGVKKVGNINTLTTETAVSADPIDIISSIREARARVFFTMANGKDYICP